MAKNDKNESLIPDKQTEKSLNAIAEYFERTAKQLRFAASQVGNDPLSVPSTTTFQRGFGFVQNWIGNLFQSITSAPLGQSASDDLTPEKSAEIDEFVEGLADKEREHKKKKEREAREKKEG